jgi:hypothetical protein
MAAGLTGRSLSLVGRPMPHERLATNAIVRSTRKRANSSATTGCSTLPLPPRWRRRSVVVRLSD